MPIDDIRQHRVEILVDEFVVIRVLQKRAHCLKEPERGVDGVVFRSFACIRKAIRQHALIDVIGKLGQNALRDFALAGC